jgi:hypothetical protein
MPGRPVPSRRMQFIASVASSGAPLSGVTRLPARDVV